MALEGGLTDERLNPDPVVPFGTHYHPHWLLPLQSNHAIPRAHLEERHVFFEAVLSHGRCFRVVHEVTGVNCPDNEGKIIRAAKTVRGHRPAFLFLLPDADAYSQLLPPLNVPARRPLVNLGQEWLVPGVNLAYNVMPPAGCQSRCEGVEQDECRPY